MSATGDFVKKYASEHPELSTMVVVRDWTRKGKGGWGSTDRYQEYYITGSKSAKSRGNYKEHAWNGVCHVCGRVFLGTVLVHACSPDPHAGQLISEESTPYGKALQNIVSPMASIVSCPDCMGKRMLSPGYTCDDRDWDRNIRYVVQSHPMCVHENDPYLFIDLTRDIPIVSIKNNSHV